MLISPVLQRLPAQFIKESVDATKFGSSCYGSSSFYVNSLQLLFGFCWRVVPHRVTVFQEGSYKWCIYLFKWFSANSELKCSHEIQPCPCLFTYITDMVGPGTWTWKCEAKCLWVCATEVTVLFIVNGGCTGGSAFLDIIIETVLPAWKLTSHASAQLPMVLKSALRMAADVSGESTTIYKLLSSANRRILAPMFLTMSFIYIRNSNGPRIEPWETPASTEAQWEAWPPTTTQCLFLYGWTVAHLIICRP